MTIELHCDHCGKLIQVPASEAGSTSPCPHCGGTNYIPAADEAAEEFPMTPLDEKDERRRKQNALEDAAFQRSLMGDQANRRSKNGRSTFQRPDLSRPPVSPPSPLSSKQLTALIVAYFKAMSGGKLEEAQKLTSPLLGHKKVVLSILDVMLTENFEGYGLPSLPRPVLMGFVKRLRDTISSSSA